MTDYTPEEFAYYLDLAAALKKDKKEGKEIQTLKGKKVDVFSAGQAVVQAEARGS